jgi:hypothetical protein
MQQEVTDTCLSKRLRAKQLHVISVDHMALHYFDHVVSPALVRTWGRTYRVQHVFEAKFYRMLCACGFGDTS